MTKIKYVLSISFGHFQLLRRLYRWLRVGTSWSCLDGVGIGGSDSDWFAMYMPGGLLNVRSKERHLHHVHPSLLYHCIEQLDDEFSRESRVQTITMFVKWRRPGVTERHGSGTPHRCGRRPYVFIFVSIISQCSAIYLLSVSFHKIQKEAFQSLLKYHNYHNT